MGKPCDPFAHTLQFRQLGNIASDGASILVMWNWLPLMPDRHGEYGHLASRGVSRDFQATTRLDQQNIISLSSFPYDNLIFDDMFPYFFPCFLHVSSQTGFGFYWMESWPSLQFGGGPCIVLDPGLLCVCCRKSYVSLQFLHRLRSGSFFVEGVSFLTPFLIVTRCSWSMFCLRGTTSTDHSYHMFSGEEGDRNVATAGSQSSTCSRSSWGPHNGWLWNFIEDVKW